MNPEAVAPFSFTCPRCRGALQPLGPEALTCPAEGLRFDCLDGIWRFLLPERQAHYAQFIREYETVRRQEGRGAADSAYYRALPYRDLSGRLSADWRIRAASFEAFLKRVLAPLERRTGRPLAGLDLGAGNGWLSGRLALRGHAVAAVDLAVNNFDGLGCHQFHAAPFTPLQAEFDRLPLPDQAFDLVVFNASLHYSESYPDTLSESLRVLRPGGKLVILDSPVYRQADSGAQMVREREAQFSRQYGFPSNTLKSENYLTYTGLKKLGEVLRVHWEFVTPAYGLRWRLRPIWARLRGAREPAKFHVIVGEKASRSG